MKKLFIIVLAVIMVSALTAFAGCKFSKEKAGDNSAEPTISASTEEGGEQTGTPADSTSTEPEDSTSTEPEDSTSAEPGQSTEQPPQPELTPYAAPTFAAGDDGITISQGEGAAITYKVDGGEWTEGASVSFDETAGDHSVVAKAAADEDHLESDEATFTYTTKEASVTVNKTSTLTATVSYVGAKLQRSEGGEFADCEQTEYTETESKNYFFKATGGWADGTYYAGEAVARCMLVKPASAAFTVEDGEGATDSILQEDWEVKKYGDSTWEDTKATITAGKSYTGSDCVVYNCWNNGVKFRYSKEYAAVDGYNMLSFDVKGDGIAKMEISIKDSNSGIYMHINLGTLPSGWYHYDLSMMDSGWQLYYAGTGYDPDMAIAYQGKDMGVSTRYEIIPYCDTLSFVFNGSTTNGANAYLYMDNIAFGYAETPATAITQPLFATGDYYVPTSTTEGYPVFYITIGDHGQTATLQTVGLEQNMTIPTTLTISGSSLTLTAEGGALTLKGNFEENGRVVALTNATGTYAQYIDLGTKYAVAANLSMDFASTPGSGDYNDPNWTQEQYITEWKVVSGQMRNRTKDGKKVVNMYANTGTTLKYTYNKSGQPIGLANYFAVDIGNYFSPNKPINVKIALVDTKGVVTYLAGSSSEWYSFAATTGLETFKVYLDAPINLQSFYFVLKGTQGDQYLYTTNYVATYKFEKEEEPEQPEPTVTEVFKLDFEDGAGTGNYVNSNWTQYKWDNSAYVTTSGRMNSRTNGSTKVTNLYCGWTTYQFIYNENGENALGKANGFSVKIGNYYATAAKTIKIRVVLVDSEGAKHYLYGTQSGFQDVAYAEGTTMTTYEKTFDEMTVQSIIFFARCENADNYLYIDDVTLTYTEQA